MFGRLWRWLRGPACEACGKPAAGVAFTVRPRAATEAGRPATDLMVSGEPVRLCRECLEVFRDDPGGFGGAGAGDDHRRGRAAGL